MMVLLDVVRVTSTCGYNNKMYIYKNFLLRFYLYLVFKQRAEKLLSCMFAVLTFLILFMQKFAHTKRGFLICFTA
jgi:hypothetical protein